MNCPGQERPNTEVRATVTTFHRPFRSPSAPVWRKAHCFFLWLKSVARSRELCPSRVTPRNMQWAPRLDHCSTRTWASAASFSVLRGTVRDRAQGLRRIIPEKRSAASGIYFLRPLGHLIVTTESLSGHPRSPLPGWISGIVDLRGRG